MSRAWGHQVWKAVGFARRRDRGWSRGLCGSGDLRAANGFDERLDAARQVGLADVERRDEANGLIVRAAGDEEDVTLERVRDRGLARLRIAELDRDHRAVAADLADVWVGRERLQLAHHERAEPLRTSHEVLVADHLQRGETRGARDWVAAEGR